jgi:hypothetical protein
MGQRIAESSWTCDGKLQVSSASPGQDILACCGIAFRGNSARLFVLVEFRPVQLPRFENLVLVHLGDGVTDPASIFDQQRFRRSR